MLHKIKMITMITALFSFPHPLSHTAIVAPASTQKTNLVKRRRLVDSRHKEAHRIQRKLQQLAGPYAHMVKSAAKKVHVPPVLVAAVVYVENGGNFYGSANRVSSAGAIGVMQLEPSTAWGTLRVNPWIPKENIQGGAHFIAMLLKQFGGNQRLALMAYNAGPGAIASGFRPPMAVAYAQTVLRDAYSHRFSEI